MTAVLALLRAGWLTALSYRVAMALSVVGLAGAVVPLYYVARALQPVVADSIQGQGSEYFGFVLVGMVAFTLMGPALNALPGAVGAGIRTGTLEAMLGTPTPLPWLLAGLVSYDLAWAAVRAAILAVAGAALGVRFSPGGLLPAVFVLAAVVAAYLPFGVLAAAAVVAFRTPGPLPAAVFAGSVLLGGVYYPPEVIPEGLRPLSAVVPLTYGLRALRRLLLEGAGPAAVASDVAALCAIGAVLLALSALVLASALRYARSAGTLAQY